MRMKMKKKKTKITKKELYNIKNFAELKKEINEIMNLFKEVIYQYEDELNSLDLNITDEYIALKYENEINQKVFMIVKKTISS